MAIDVGHVQEFRRYVLEYVVGLLWLFALIVTTVDRALAVAVASTARVVAVSAAPVYIPDAAATGALLLLAILLPYALAIAVGPLNQLAFNGLRFLRNRIFPYAIDENDMRILREAKLRIGIPLGFPIVLPLDNQIMAVALKSAPLAEQLRRDSEDWRFRSAAVTPAALLCGATLYRVFSSPLAGALASVLLLAIGVWDSLDRMYAWVTKLQVAILMTHPAGDGAPLGEMGGGEAGGETSRMPISVEHDPPTDQPSTPA